MKRLILNADDFGLSPGVNRGIVEAFREGVLSSTTMLCNFDHFEEAVELADANPDLPVGVHLSLLWGAPVLPASSVPSLVDAQGQFGISSSSLAKRYASGRLRGDEVRREFQAQAERFLAAGLVPTHFDSHKHIHALPPVMEALLDVATELGVSKVRLPHETRLPGLSRPPRNLRSRLDTNLLRVLTRDHRRKLSERGLRTTDHFVGLDMSECLDAAALRYFFAALPPGSSEVKCHPGYNDWAALRWSTRPPDRLGQLRALCDAAVVADANQVELISYREL